MTMNRDAWRAKADQVPTEIVDVPEWDEKVRIRMIGTSERLQWMLAGDKLRDGEDGPDPTALLVVLAVVDDDGKRIFEAQDCDWLGSDINGAVVEKIAQRVAEMNGLIDVEKAIEDAEGNSDATTSGETPTDLQPSSDAPSLS